MPNHPRVLANEVATSLAHGFGPGSFTESFQGNSLDKKARVSKDPGQRPLTLICVQYHPCKGSPFLTQIYDVAFGNFKKAERQFTIRVQGESME